MSKLKVLLDIESLWVFNQVSAVKIRTGGAVQLCCLLFTVRVKALGICANSPCLPFARGLFDLCSFVHVSKENWLRHKIFNREWEGLVSL